MDKGIEINSYPQEDLARVQKLIDKHTEEIAAKEPLFKKSIESQIEFRKKFARWRQMEGPFGFGYNPASYPNLEK